MLSRIIVNSYKPLIEIALWLTLLMAIVGSWLVAWQFFYDPVISIFAVIPAIAVWFIMAVVSFGTFLVLEDIRQRVKNIEESSKIRVEGQGE